MRVQISKDRCLLECSEELRRAADKDEQAPIEEQAQVREDAASDAMSLPSSWSS